MGLVQTWDDVTIWEMRMVYSPYSRTLMDDHFVGCSSKLSIMNFMITCISD
jgi:hypothetical protein